MHLPSLISFSTELAADPEFQLLFLMAVTMSKVALAHLGLVKE